MLLLFMLLTVWCLCVPCHWECPKLTGIWQSIILQSQDVVNDCHSPDVTYRCLVQPWAINVKLYLNVFYLGMKVTRESKYAVLLCRLSSILQVPLRLERWVRRSAQRCPITANLKDTLEIRSRSVVQHGIAVRLRITHALGCLTVGGFTKGRKELVQK